MIASMLQRASKLVTTGASPPGSVRAPALAALLIVVAALIAYHNSFSGAFVFDDRGAILDNPTIRRLWSPEVLSPPIHGLPVTGRPVTNLSLAINYAIHGTGAWGYHAANLAIHIVCALLLLGVVRRTVEVHGSSSPAFGWHRPAEDPDPAAADGRSRAALYLAAVAALLWVVHPLQTAAVTYISQRAESLGSAFILLALYAFIRGTTGSTRAAARAGAQLAAPLLPGGPDAARCAAAKGDDERTGCVWLIVSIVACWLGVGAKEITFAIPLLIALYDRTFLRGTWREVFRGHPWFYLALFASWLPLAWLIHSTENRGATWAADSGFTPWTYALVQCEALVHYLRLVFWPAPLVFDYGRNLVVPTLASVWPQAILVVSLLAATIAGLRRWPAAAFPGVVFFAVLAPTSSFVPIADAVFEHRMYLPSAAVILAVVLAGYRWFGPRAGWVAAPAIVMLCVLTIARNADYRSPLTLWSDTVDKRPDNARARGNLGEVFSQLQRHEEALPHFEAAYRLTPHLPLASHNLANALDLLGRREDAIRYYREALALQPKNFLARTNLASALAETGAIDEALTHYEMVLRDSPDFAVAQHGYGRALLRAGRLDEAGAALRRSVELRPGNPDYQFSLADALVRARRLPEAIEALRATLQLRPDDIAALNNLGNALLLTRQVSEAIAAFEQALRLKPEATTHTNLGLAFLLTQRREEAISQFEAALRLDPNHARAREALNRLRP